MPLGSFESEFDEVVEGDSLVGSTIVAVDEERLNGLPMGARWVSFSSTDRQRRGFNQYS